MKKLYLQIKNKNPRKDNANSMLVEVEMTDTKKVFGKTKRLITPSKGFGYIWVDDETLKIK